MAKLSKVLKISISFTFVVLFTLLSITLLSEKNSVLNSGEIRLRRLGAETVIFKILEIFNYIFFPFFIVAVFVIPCFYCIKSNSNSEQDNETDEIVRNYGFIFNHICYIINIFFLISSCVNFIFGIKFNYSLTVFVFSCIYFLTSSIIYIIFSTKAKELCFAGICEWKYLKMMFTAGCCFFAPCNNNDCQDFLKLTCEEFNCCSCFIYLIAICYYIANFFIYYLGLLVYSIFWLISKFFVFISCSDDCWCKEEYDMDHFMKTGKSKTSIISSSTEDEKKDDDIDEKEVKQIIDQFPKDKKKKIKFSLKVFKGLIKKIEEEEKKESK